jgi:hypothetical protein
MPSHLLLFLSTSLANSPQNPHDDLAGLDDQSVKPSPLQITGLERDQESQKAVYHPETRSTRRHPSWSNSRTTLSLSLTTLSKATTRSSRRHTTGRSARLNSSGELLSCENMANLYRRIKESMELKTTTSTCFLAESLLKELICESTVKTALEQHGLETNVSEIAAFIRDKGRRLFAILVYAGQAKQIEKYYENGFTDDLLPVKVKSRNDNGYTLESLATKGANLKAVDATFSSWDEQAIDHFCEVAQWPFLAPVFREEKFQYAFYEESRMPFLDLRSVTESNFSIVSEGYIHRDHLQIQTDSKIVRCDISTQPS